MPYLLALGLPLAFGFIGMINVCFLVIITFL